MSWLIGLRIGILPYVSSYLSYGVDFAKGQFRLSSGVVALCRWSGFLFAVFGCFRSCFLWLGCGWVLFGLVVFGLFAFLFGLCCLFLVAERFSDHRLQYMGIVWL